MRFDILTLFPEFVSAVLDESIIGRARKAGKLEIHTHQIRDWSEDRHRRVDDTPYGGGKGMVMAAPPLVAAMEAVAAMGEGDTANARRIYMSPKGRLLNQKEASRLTSYDRLIILCGHYEGIDERVIDLCIDEQISIGDYVLTGGELPACILCDCVGRLCPGVLSDDECHEIESFAGGLLEYPQYTRPQSFRGLEVPEVLQNGNHAHIERWRYEKSLELTKKLRPDLL
ncbi:MAG TPA: tRNA (guanosine(37)-N1)-methyltransferase TrmD [Clostridiales bacterium]|jgi:tRNA (guanine37-N1)-methyltransferase|nr:tRNA (guanosine(37)-N1)-methyltransferase TrmD [Clostridiales bacterium]